MKMASLKDISERYKRVCESFIKKTVKTGLKDKGDSVFKLPENYIEIALMKIIESRGIEEVDIDYSEILQENPIDKSKWVPTLVYIDTDDNLFVRWDKFLAYNTECGCIDVYENSDTYESFYGQNEYVQTELYREVLDALGMEYVEPETMYYQTLESFVGHVSRKRSSDLVSDIDYPDGVYILHETLGVRDVEGWNPNDNNGVVGILVVEDEHKIVVALEDSPENLHWSKKNKLVNASIGNYKDAESDFNGENHCIKLNSPDFPAAYYCLNYKKGGRSWYLPSSGELWMIYNHLEEIQSALEAVGGQKFVDKWDDDEDGDTPFYWSSTELGVWETWGLSLDVGEFSSWGNKVDYIFKVRPVSNFSQNKNLKESFTKKIKSTRKSDLNSKPSFELFDGVYIFHETLGVQDVEGWDSKNNDGVVGILVVDGEHQIVFATEESPERLRWTISRGEFNQIIPNRLKAEFDFDGETYCRNLNSPKFPAAYYCLNYDKGGQKWYLPSAGELCLAYEYLDEIQTAMDAVGGQEFMTEWVASRNNRPLPVYWSSTEQSETLAWGLDFTDNQLYWHEKAGHLLNVRPVCKLNMDSLKESFTKKIKSTRKSDLNSKPSFVLDNGVYVLHETLGLRSVEGWNIKDNQGVVGVVIIDPRQNLVISKNDSPMKLTWSVSENDGRNKEMNVNKKLKRDVAKTDLQGEKYAIKLRERIGNCPASDYCLSLKDGGRKWYLPSAGQMFLIYDYINDVQNALIEVGGHPLYTGNIGYWTSTERTFNVSFEFNFGNGQMYNWSVKNTSKLFVRPVSTFDYDRLEESFTRKTSKTKDEDLRTRADESVLPKNYIDLALMSVLCSAKKEGICFRKPKFRYKDDFGDVYELSEIFLQNDGFEIGSYEQNHYLEIEWNVYENGYMEEEPVSDYYPFKDEDDEIKIEIYKRVLQYLDMEYVSPNIRWMEFDDEGFDYFDN